MTPEAIETCLMGGLASICAMVFFNPGKACELWGMQQLSDGKPDPLMQAWALSAFFLCAVCISSIYKSSHARRTCLIVHSLLSIWWDLNTFSRFGDTFTPILAVGINAITCLVVLLLSEADKL